MELIDSVIKEIEELDDALQKKYIPKSHYGIKTNLKPLWKLSKEKSNLLIKLTKQHNPKTILELGTSSGYSALNLRKASKTAKIYSIEFDEKKVELAKHHFNKAKVNIVVIQARVNNALNQWQEPLDLVFMDCDKNYLHYFNQLKPCLNPKALIIVDNYEKSNDFTKMVKEEFNVREEIGLLFFHYDIAS